MYVQHIGVHKVTFNDMTYLALRQKGKSVEILLVAMSYK